MIRGTRNEYHPGRQVGRERFPPPIDRAGAWGNPRAIVAPLSDDSSQGAVNAAYNAIRASTDMTGTDANQMIRDATRSYNPNGQISVGIRQRPNLPLSEQPGRGALAGPSIPTPLQRFPGSGEGLYSVQPTLTPEQFEQPQQVSNMGPVGDFINQVRPQEIA